MASTQTWEEHLRERTVLPTRVEFKSRGYPGSWVGEALLEARIMQKVLNGDEATKVTVTEVGKYPEFVLGELADVPAVVESTGFGRIVAVMRAKARAVGLAESEVEKISTCPLVRLLVKGN